MDSKEITTQRQPVFGSGAFRGSLSSLPNSCSDFDFTQISSRVLENLKNGSNLCFTWITNVSQSMGTFNGFSEACWNDNGEWQFLNFGKNLFGQCFPVVATKPRILDCDVAGQWRHLAFDANSSNGWKVLRQPKSQWLYDTIRRLGVKHGDIIAINEKPFVGWFIAYTASEVDGHFDFYQNVEDFQVLKIPVEVTSREPNIVEEYTELIDKVRKEQNKTKFLLPETKLVFTLDCDHAYLAKNGYIPQDSKKGGGVDSRSLFNVVVHMSDTSDNPPSVEICRECFAYS